MTLGSNGNAASVYLYVSRQSMTFTPTSRLLLGGGFIDMGYMKSPAKNTLDIKQGASLVSLSAAGIGVGDKLTHSAFIQKANTGSASDFIVYNAVDNGSGSYSTATLNYTLNTTDFDATVTRVALPSSMTTGNGGAYLSQLEKALQNNLVGDVLNPAALEYAQYIAYADHLGSTQGIKSMADDLVRTATPQHTINAVPQMALQANRVTRNLFALNLQKSGGFGAGALNAFTVRDAADNAATDTGKDGVSALQNPASPARGFSMWAQPFYHNGKLDADSRQYSDTDIEFYGGSIGLAYDADLLVAALSFHFMGGDMDASGWDADADAYGLTLGLGRGFALSEGLKLWAQIHGGYTRYEFDQTRRDFSGQRLSSEPDADVYTFGALTALDIALGQNFSLTPSLGLDYSRIEIDSYTETGGSMALKVSPDDYDSLIGSLGLAGTWQPLPELSLQLRGNYYYEFEDTEAKFQSRAVNLPDFAFVTKGQDADRHSGSIGTGLAWKPTEVVSIGLDYDYSFSEHYTGHQVYGLLKLEF
ncbi:autotransporter outer membrane beta-barrel domain-containing protein [Desulfovibrio sp. OttesenSCG-928-M16]|nr:autotransporter outer membrane beta-barrel domain-containing protein [Desulfovibrio sp. OttesenSCG-928-M16]